MTLQNFRQDAAESTFFARQLEHIMPQTFDVKYPQFRSMELIPVDMSAGPGAGQITYRQYDQVGQAKLVASYAKDFPRVDVKAKEFTSTVKSLGASFGYNIQELRAGEMAARQLADNSAITLDQRRAAAAVRSMAQKIDDIAFAGDSASGLVGFSNNANVTTSNAANALSSASTPDQILAVLNKAVNDVVALTNGLEQPTDLLLPYAQYNYISSTARSANSDTTILKYFLQNNPYIKSVSAWYKLAGAGASGSDLMIVYVRDAEHLSLQLPVATEMFPPQQNGMEFEVMLHARIGGVLNYYPLAMSYVSHV